MSTGSPQLDELLLRQVVTAKVPKPFGLDLGEAHQFELPLRMLTPDDSFRYKVYAAIGRQRFYGREGILAGDTGISTVNFDYRDGRVANVVITESSGHSELDKYSLQAVSRADMPVAPPAYAGQTLHLQARFCYDLNFAKKCPTGNDVIDVEGTRIVRRTFITY
ncbi:MAG: TonB family protein [Gammaproteobacteria bacterium]